MDLTGLRREYESQGIDVGDLDPDQIHVPSVFVKRIFQGSNYQKWIEKRTVRNASQA